MTSLFGPEWNDSPPPAESDDWDTPIPLGQARTLPPFPAAALPAWLGDAVAAVSEETQTPLDLAGSLALAVLATAAGGRAEVSVRGRWREPVNLYTVVALPPGNRKSAVFAFMAAPLLAVEQTMADASGAARAEAETMAKLAKAAAEKAAGRAAGAPADEKDKLTAEAVALAQAAESATVPEKPQLIIDDITPENAATLLDQQGGRIAALSAEGGLFDIIAGRYSSGGPNMDVFLKAHAGDMIRVNRQGRESQFIKSPALTIGLAVQPAVLDDIAKVRGFEGRGLLARFLYALPASLVGQRNLEPQIIPDEVADTYAATLKELTLAMADWTDPAVLTLTPDADRAVLDQQKRTEPMLAKGGALAHVVTWASKLDGAVVRIAGLLHLATHPADGYTRPIEKDTIDAAARIGEYYAAHALAVFDAMGSDPALGRARTVLTHLRTAGGPVVTKRELFRGLARGDFPTVADLDPALALLEEHGWIRQEAPPARTGRGGRPPSPRYQTHPDITQPAL
ncbi:YfjI family protein [Kitasatospora sp. NPDC057223]|uniref:YfjI family protein n=1 Tax=Kitasatospora sp. NPDC057223 TaxID=3346055 RepID=UPI00362946C1